jgi:hypothetical protein
MPSGSFLLNDVWIVLRVDPAYFGQAGLVQTALNHAALSCGASANRDCALWACDREPHAGAREMRPGWKHAPQEALKKQMPKAVMQLRIGKFVSFESLQTTHI